jgi:hypothetical protein
LVLTVLGVGSTALGALIRDAALTVATSTFDEGSHHLAPWGGFAVLCGYTAMAVAAAAIGMVRRDA